MRSFLPAPLVLTIALSAADAPAIRFEAVAAPTAPGAFGATIAAQPDGNAWLIWFEPAGSQSTLRVSTFDRATRQWRAPGTIAGNLNVQPDTSTRPALSVGERGDGTVVWIAAAPPTLAANATTGPATPHNVQRAFVSQTSDHAQSWTAPAPLTTASDAVEHVSLAPLADGRVLAAWLDGRGNPAGGDKRALYSRVIGVPGSDQLIDDAVSAGCPTALTSFPNGSALVSYRGRTTEDIRDLRVARYHHHRWESPHAVHDDGWRTNAAPDHGPHLASDGGRVAVTWFTATQDEPRVLASLSPDAGSRFLMPLRISETKAAGHVSTVLLHDGAMLVSWVDADGGLWLRRVTPDFVTTEPLALVASGRGRIIGRPRLVLLQDYAGGKSVAQLLIGVLRDQEPALQTLLVTVPEGDLVEAEKNCDCSGGSDDLQGFALRGRILAAKSPTNTLRVTHYEVPGMLDEGAREFVLAPDVTLPADVIGRPFLGRFERRSGQWVLFSVRLIGAAPVEK